MTGAALNPHQQVYVSKWVTFVSCALLQVSPPGITVALRAYMLCESAQPAPQQQLYYSTEPRMVLQGLCYSSPCSQTLFTEQHAPCHVPLPLQACAGLAYSFSVYAPTIKDSLDLTQTQLATVGSAVNLGGYFAIVSGSIYDALKDYHKLGPRCVDCLLPHEPSASRRSAVHSMVAIARGPCRVRHSICLLCADSNLTTPSAADHASAAQGLLSATVAVPVCGACCCCCAGWWLRWAACAVYVDTLECTSWWRDWHPRTLYSFSFLQQRQVSPRLWPAAVLE